MSLKGIIVKIGANVSGLKEGVGDAKKELKGLSESAGKTSGALKGIGSSSGIAGGALKSFGPMLAATLSVGAAVGFGKAVFTAFSDFEAGMSAVQAKLSDADPLKMQELTAQATLLGGTTKFSASEAAGAMEALATAGFSAAEVMASMPSVLSLAAAGGIGLGQAADQAAGLIRGFGLDASQAGMVADTLAFTAGSAKTNIGELGAAFTMVAAPAKGAGLSIQETSSVLGVLANNMIGGSMAGTAFRSILLRLQAPSNEASEALKAMGVEVTDSSDKMRPFADIMEDIAASGATTKQQIALFGQEAFSAGKIIVENSGQLRSYATEITEAGGAAKTMADTMGDNLKGKVKGLSSAWEGLLISIGKDGGFGDIASSAVEALTTMVRGATDAVSAIGAAWNSDEGLLAGVKAAMVGIKDEFMKGWNEVVALFGPIVDELAELFGGPGGGVLMKAWEDFWKSLKLVVSVVFDAVVMVLKIALGQVKAVIEIANGIINGSWEQIWAGMKSMVEGQLNAVLAFVEGAVTAIGEFFGVDLSGMVQKASLSMDDFETASKDVAEEVRVTTPAVKSLTAQMESLGTESGTTGGKVGEVAKAVKDLKADSRPEYLKDLQDELFDVAAQAVLTSEDIALATGSWGDFIAVAPPPPAVNQGLIDLADVTGKADTALVGLTEQLALELPAPPAEAAKEAFDGLRVAASSIVDSILTGDFSISGAIATLKPVLATFAVETLAQFGDIGEAAGSIVTGLISGDLSLKGALQSLAPVIDKLIAQFVTWSAEATGLGDKIGKLGGLGGSAPSKAPVPGVPGGGGGWGGAAGTASGDAGGAAASGASTAGGFASGPITGLVSAVANVATAVSSIIGNFQMAEMTNKLKAVEHNTRFTMQYVGARQDGGLVTSNLKILEWTQYGVGATAQVNESLWAIRPSVDRVAVSTSYIVTNTDDMKSTLWDIRGAIRDLKPGNEAQMPAAPAPDPVQQVQEKDNGGGKRSRPNRLPRNSERRR